MLLDLASLSMCLHQYERVVWQRSLIHVVSRRLCPRNTLPSRIHKEALGRIIREEASIVLEAQSRFDDWSPMH
jgi:hypothetical protein